MMTTRLEQPLLHGALDLAEIGVPVFPLGARSKIPAISKKRGGRGMEDATTDAAQIIEWWSEYPNANIAIRTGVTVDVLDIDGPEAFEALEKLRGYEPIDAPMVKTSRGWHFWFAASGLKSRTGFTEHCDFRGLDASATAPPSVHESGHVYEWVGHVLSGPDLDLNSDLSLLPPVPDWLRTALRPKKLAAPKLSRPTYDTFQVRGRGGGKSEQYVRTVVSNEILKLKNAGEGTRNHTLNECSFNIGQMCGDHLYPFDQAAEELLDAARAIGLPDRESVETIKSGLNNGMNSPRSRR